MSPERILALLLALVLLANALQAAMVLRLKRIKAVADEVKAESARIHVLVNSRLTLALAQNEALKDQINGLIGRIAELTDKGV